MNLTMPRLSDTMEEGTVGKWLKKEGDSFKKGEAIAEIQTDKANMELEAFQDGVIEKILVQEGQTVPVGEPIAIIRSPSEAPAPSEAPTTEEPKHEAKPQEPVQEQTPQPAESSIPIAPREEAGTAGPQSRIKASPLARRIAQELGIDLATVKGTGPNGRIKREDVERAAASRTQAPKVEETPAAAEAVPPSRVEPFTRIQSIIAQRMVQSKTQVPHIYITIELDMSKAIALRQEINQLGEPPVSFNDMVIKACGLALRNYPLANASYVDGGIKYNEQVNVGFAVATKGALYVPVIRDADKKNLRQIAAETRALIGKARENKLSPQDLSGGTFTVSNLGMYGVEEFQAVVNQPEAAILAVGAITQKPVVQDGQIVIGNRMRVTLSADHRVLYGADAAEFLNELRKFLENPLLLAF